MSNSDKRRIVISLEISVPQCQESDAPRLSVQRLRKPERSSSRQLEMVHVPHPGQDYPVKLLGSGFGIICARGDGYQYATEVRGCCYQSTPSDSFPPVNADSAPIASNFWQLSAVPQAAIGFNILRVWYIRSGSVVLTEDRAFNGVASTHTFCETPFCGEPVSAAPTRIYLPSQLTVHACGFSKEVSCFNGVWTLNATVCLDDVQRAVWRAAGHDGLIVELVADLQQASATLTFRQQAMEIRYRKEAGEWNPVNVVDFADVSSRAIVPGASIPAIIQVHPRAAQ